MRYRHGLVVGKFYPPHAGHHALIDAAADACDRVTVVVAPSSAESIPLDLRLEWLREAHGPHVRFVGVYDDHPIDYADPAVWDLHMRVFRAAVGADRVDVVFSSEAYGAELSRRFGAGAVLVDPGRARVPVSGTAIRADPVAYWEHLGPGARAWLTRRVIVVGAESTGTTAMARALARHYRTRGGVWSTTRWVPEYGRELTERKLAVLRESRPSATVFDVVWDRDDFVAVAEEQRAAEDAAARSGSPVLFGDTDAFATTIWEERYLGSTSVKVRELVRDPDLYLLTEAAGVPFEDDGLRDGEHLRGWMTERFRTELAVGGTPYLELGGSFRKRLQGAVRAVDELIARGWRFTPPLSANGSGMVAER
ncbi:AAA family ATPase [Actinoplanes sp. NPDC051851]|uniref:AAA family ATPase n=1 Tax=Actinoplanes sp. NPDC051851 TaxID=3154753 RepID=UPI003434E365